MPQHDVFALPFVTRDQLDSGANSTFELQVQSSINASGGHITIAGVTKAGPFRFDHVTVQGSVTTTLHSIPDFPIWVSAINESLAFSAGRCYVNIRLKMNGNMVRELTAGYIGGLKGISWPDTPQIDTIPNRGLMNFEQVSNPAAGADWSYTIAAGTSRNLLAVGFQLVTDANAATRTVSLIITPGPIITIPVISTTTQIASLTRVYAFTKWSGAFGASVGTQIVNGLPYDLPLINPSTIATTTTNKQAGDQFSNIWLYYEEFQYL